LRIVIAHLTRMNTGICVAGVTPGNLRNIRPVREYGTLGRSLLRGEGGVFRVGAQIDLGDVTPRPAAPEVEDVVFDPTAIALIEQLPADQLYELLEKKVRPSLTAVFGDSIEKRKRNAAVPQNQGAASLGYLDGAGGLLEVDPWGKIRFRINDSLGEIHAPVTDIRLVEADNKTVKGNRVTEWARAISRGDPVIVAVGLARAYTAPGDDQQRHWLQVNNIHFAA
jgi:putative nucleic acid modification protein with dual OB domain